VHKTAIKSIKDWTSPKSPTEIRQFLGLAGAPILVLPKGSEDFIAYCYRCFEEGFGRCVDAKRKGDFLCITPVKD
ncbi:hypothetical protein Tco_0325935, partial [Tanacetum coccineum]